MREEKLKKQVIGSNCKAKQSKQEKSNVRKRDKETV